MARGEKLFAALGAPFDRALQHTRRECGDDVLGVQRSLHPEAAADVADDDAHRLRRDPEHFVAQIVAQSGRRLAADRQRDASGRRIE